MIKAIAFDFGGTLFSTARMGHFTPAMIEAFVEQVMGQLGCSRDHAERVFSLYTEAWKARRARAGDLPERELSSADLLQTALTASGSALDRVGIVAVLDAFHTRESEQFSPLTGVVESLRDLVASGYRLCIVSNNPWAESIRASLRRCGIEECFEHVIVSCDVGFRKPHRRIFEEFLTKLALPAEAVVFVGDSYPHDIEIPKTMGMKTCLVDFEGLNKNSQRDHAPSADWFLTRFAELAPALASRDVRGS